MGSTLLPDDYCPMFCLHPSVNKAHASLIRTHPAGCPGRHCRRFRHCGAVAPPLPAASGAVGDPRQMSKADGPRAAAAIGIDFGTTYSRVAVWRGHGVEIIAKDHGNRSTPSWVAFTEHGQPLVGESARDRARFEAGGERGGGTAGGPQ